MKITKMAVYRYPDPEMVGLYVYARPELGRSQGETMRLTTDGWKPAPPGVHAEPLVWIPEECLQVLADSLWDAGVRPSGAKGSAGQLAAVEKHLEDMRHIVSKHVGVWLPGTGPKA